MTQWRACLLLACLPLVACAGDETLTAYGASGKSWQLTEIDGQPAPAPASITFPEAATIAGRAPCNRFTGAVTAPYPWFATGNLAVTRMICPDQPAEDAFFAALSAMTLAEVTGDTLILSTPEGRSMVFNAGD